MRVVCVYWMSFKYNINSFVLGKDDYNSLIKPVFKDYPWVAVTFLMHFQCNTCIEQIDLYLKSALYY